MKLETLLNDLLNLVYPNVCMLCADGLIKGEQYICTSCLVNLPKTNFEFGKPNPVDQIFWGRVKIKAATSLYWFEKGGNVQEVLHQIKYKGQKELGEYLGKKMAYDILKVLPDPQIDLVCPVPLHRKKLRIRGYNQSDWIGKGVSSVLQKPIYSNLLVRRTFTSTQTKKTKIDRWDNVKDVFEAPKPELITNKNILIIDDVTTTGATLESCAIALQKHQCGNIYVATLAYAL